MRKSALLFFLTGAAALVYQTVWARWLTRVLGSDAGGTAVVLATFMGGMALGAALFGPRVRRSARPVRLFAGIELALGLWAALTPWWLTHLPAVDGLAARALASAALLLVPTVLMGVTFPLMGRLTIAGPGDVARETAGFYAANTLGAACGALLGALVFMPRFGLTGAVLLAAGLDVLAAAAAPWLLRAAPLPPPADAGAAPQRFPWLGEPLLAATLLLGASALALEVLLTRLLVSVTGASVYAFAIVLAVFLGGIALGSHSLRSVPAGTERRAFLRAALAVPLAVLAGLALLAWQLGERDLFSGLANRMPSGASVGRLWIAHAFFAALALSGPAWAFGRALPAAVAAAAQARPGVPRESVLSAVYAANTLGALLGALVAAFVLLPNLGLRGALAVTLCVPWLAALPALRGAGFRPRDLALPGLALVAAGYVLWPAPRADAARLVSSVHGAHASVSVEENGAGADLVRSLRVNGKVVATTAPVDLRLQRLLAQIPALLHGEVTSGLVIGMGTGMTAGALLDIPSLETLEVIEIEAELIEGGARHFGAWNGALLDDPRTRVHVGDGRHRLARDARRFDLITADPIHPWTRGSSDLYALEHFSAIEAHLTPGGVASQWLPLYQLSAADVRTVVATWCAAFAETSAWLSAYDLVLVGARAPLRSLDELAQGAVPEAMARSLAQAGVHSAPELVALCVADDAALRAFAGETAAMREDRPVLEFRAPLSFLAGYSTEALAWAGRPDFVAALPGSARLPARRAREALARFLAALPQGLSRAAEAYGAELLALPPAGASLLEGSPKARD